MERRHDPPNQLGPAFWLHCATRSLCIRLDGLQCHLGCCNDTSRDRREDRRQHPDSQLGQHDLSLGKFSYSVGVQLLGSLLAGAAAASPIHNSSRMHEKLDSTGYTYVGRSYGVGSSVGLGQVNFKEGRDLLGWKYQEVGYAAKVNCIYNKSANFVLNKKETLLWAAEGEMPDSDDGGEYSNYVGYGDGNNVLAIGVAHFKDHNATVAPVRRYISFAGGFWYKFLDQAQCEVDFEPTRFNVTVNNLGKNITVEPTNDTDVPDIDPSRWLKGVLLRQFELIANDETNLYVSTVGSAFNNSITGHLLSLEMNGTTSVSDNDINLRGIENAIISMVDDMLAAYASAQLVVGNFKDNVKGTVRVTAVAIGEKRFAIAAFALNMVVAFIFLLEALRTRGWKDLPEFDPSDIRHVMIAASEGGGSLAKAGFTTDSEKLGKIQVRYGETGTGRYALAVEELASPTVKYENMRSDSDISYGGAGRNSVTHSVEGGMI
ncbi:hypothetical protein B0J15DRAFT_57870 [Fusarium solani]|uniref:Uncharacterized protein n=1 Tax=Fusarium solani TaxID=169388 RepID=A0A9P9K9W7_FUSSL|nr:uncharacterized protein B0J15DRAFT_57870 [Fusarium solani]KAH7249495.1 hypothetical protein B0J15DRAFT_57870 [Fusarium solani]